MKRNSKAGEIRDDFVLDLLSGRKFPGEKLKSRDFYVNKYLCNPNLVESAFQEMKAEGLLEKVGEDYVLSLSQEKKKDLEREFANRYMNDFLEKMEGVGLSIEEALNYLQVRAGANG